MNLKEIVGNIKRPYLTPMVIFAIIFTLFFSSFMYFAGNIQGKLPIYLDVFLIFGVVISILMYIQEKSETVKVSKRNVLIYLTLNVLTGYTLVLLIASVYVFGATVNGFDVFNYWLGIILMLFVSWFALFLFYKNEFDSENPNKAVNVIAIIIKLSAFGGLFYIRTVVPNTADEEKFITLSILINIAVDALLVRSYFNYALYKSVKKDIENGVDD
ncbi:DUF5079 family protein [Staphylococcus argenteus]|uniref:DUF5079 family protein n=1 Tax=Staphylococcus argenteus TaxID=985002 RepID=A0A7U7JSM3_9STAP|nr:DUF5079 family protein [Staphylococcus argenteus]BBN30736.1 hypothetical protein KUH140087_1607 [Staphylococcus aureus]API78346.1 DUF5079 domain-containing protein [Staphylococcus argenteus]ATY55949.1 DUF5079 domain-containing protein [Staphylococcus argenteus]ATZ86188.1 DUF5079 domain-containing protein [Staphylococcus argenteus]EKF1505250.1 DUF5079 family protein [Staphylococcus argenteus]